MNISGLLDKCQQFYTIASKTWIHFALCSFLIPFYSLNCRAIHGIWLCGAVITQIQSQSIPNGLCIQLVRFWIVCLADTHLQPKVFRLNLDVGAKWWLMLARCSVCCIEFESKRALPDKGHRIRRMSALILNHTYTYVQTLRNWYHHNADFGWG